MYMPFVPIPAQSWPPLLSCSIAWSISLLSNSDCLSSRTRICASCSPCFWANCCHCCCCANAACRAAVCRCSASSFSCAYLAFRAAVSVWWSCPAACLPPAHATAATPSSRARPPHARYLIRIAHIVLLLALVDFRQLRYGGNTAFDERVAAHHRAVCPPCPFGRIGQHGKFVRHHTCGHIGPQFGMACLACFWVAKQPGQPACVFVHRLPFRRFLDWRFGLMATAGRWGSGGITGVCPSRAVRDRASSILLLPISGRLRGVGGNQAHDVIGVVACGVVQVVRHATHPAAPEGVERGQPGKKADALGVKAQQQVVFRQGRHGGQRHIADLAVVRHLGRALQHTRRIAVAVVDAGVQKLIGQALGQFVALVALPKRGAVDFDGLRAGHVAHRARVAVGQRGALGNAPFGFPARVFRVVHVAALVGEHAVDKCDELVRHKKSL
nr:MAG TPA: hypothetical protein [Caudoviricetes sp.]